MSDSLTLNMDKYKVKLSPPRLFGPSWSPPTPRRRAPRPPTPAPPTTTVSTKPKINDWTKFYDENMEKIRQIHEKLEKMRPSLSPPTVPAADSDTQLESKMRSAIRKRNLLKEKLRELERTGADATAMDRTRELLCKVKNDIEEKNTKLASSRTRMEYEKQQNLLRKMKEKEKTIDVAFLLDCTKSMRRHIDAAKANITDIVEKIKER